MKRNLKRVLTTIAATILMMLSWQTPARASGSVGSISSTGIRITFQHPGYTAHGLPLYQGKRYRVCIGSLIKGETCTNGDGQSLDYYGVVEGTTYRIVVWCGCKGSGRLAVPIPIRLMDVQYTHSAPAPPTPPRIVRLRSAQSGLCLYASPDRFLRSYACGPNPAMSFAIEPAAAGGMQVRHLNSGVCIFGSFPNTTALRTAPCGTFGTVVWIMNNVNGTFRLNILATEDTVTGLGPSRGPGGCIRPAPVQLGQATKGECTYGGNVVDVFYLDPA